MDTERVWREIESERLRTSELLESLQGEQWEAQSLCGGWRVRDVVAHLTLATRARPLAAAVGVIRHGGNPNRWVAADAVARSARSPEELISELRAAAASRHHPPGTKPLDPLVDILVHTQDIAIPLGIDHQPTSLEAAAAGADRVWRMGFPFHARRKLGGLLVSATDVDFERGTGPVVEGPIVALLSLLTGRRGELLSRFDGEGVRRLT